MFTKFKYDIPLEMVDSKHIMTCDFEMQCYFVFNKKSHFVDAKFDNDGIELPFQKQGRVIIAPLKQMAWAKSGKNER